MRSKTWFAWLCCALLAFAAPAGARDVKVIDLAVHPSGDAEPINGPVVLVLNNLNRLRYDIQIGGEVKLVDGPDLSVASFVFSFPSTPTTNKGKGTTPNAGAGAHALLIVGQPGTVSTIEGDLSIAEDHLSDAAASIRTKTNGAKRAGERLSDTNDLLAALVQRSDDVLASDAGVAELQKEILDQKKEIDSALADVQKEGGQDSWPSDRELESLHGTVDDSSRELEAITNSSAFEQWKGKTEHYLRFSKDQDTAKQLSKAILAIERGGDQRQLYENLEAQLAKWQSWLAYLSANEHLFSWQLRPIDCGYPFFKTKTITVKATLHDRAPALAASITAAEGGGADTSMTSGTGGAGTPKPKLQGKAAIKRAVAKADTTEETLVTVECPSVASVTGGVGVSGLEQREIKFVSGSAPNNTTQNRFGLGDHGAIQVNPLILINTRVLDRQSWDLHASAGTVFDINNSSSKTGIAYVLGLSGALRDTLFLTIGAQIGRVNQLGGGFHLGDAVPDKLASPPIERQWKAAWFVSATYRITSGSGSKSSSSSGK